MSDTGSDHAKAAGLRYSTDEDRGISRRRDGLDRDESRLLRFLRARS